MSAPHPDTVVRAITDDGAFRVIVALTTATVRGTARAQRAGGAAAARLGELLTGAVLIREAMAPQLRVQAILKEGSRGSMVADAHPDGTSRGLVSFGAATGGDGGGQGDAPARGLLQVMRTLPSGALHQGLVEVPAVGGVSGALMAYMQDSEQVVTYTAVSTVLTGDEVRVAGGYLVQLLPEVERGPLMVMTERLSDFPSMESLLGADGVAPAAILDELLFGMPFTRLSESPLAFGCHCSQVRLVASLATLPRTDVEELIRDGQVLEITCDYCRKEYRIPPAQLRPLLTPS